MNSREQSSASPPGKDCTGIRRSTGLRVNHRGLLERTSAGQADGSGKGRAGKKVAWFHGFLGSSPLRCGCNGQSIGPLLTQVKIVTDHAVMYARSLGLFTFILVAVLQHRSRIRMYLRRYVSISHLYLFRADSESISERYVRYRTVNLTGMCA